MILIAKPRKFNTTKISGYTVYGVLFNDTLNTFYLQLYGVRHMVKDHSDSKRGRKEGNVLFNDALNTFYLVIWLRTYG